MEIFLDCLPCILRQVLEASRMSTDNTELQRKIMEEAISLLGNYKAYRNSPEVCRDMHRLVKDLTGVFDPYNEIKQKDIETALRLFPMLKRFLSEKQDRLYWALKVAATGNVLDSAINSDLMIDNCIDVELQKPFTINDVPLFKQHLQTARSLLIIGDNAGETVFDRVLLEELPYLNITYAVRNAPIINDVTCEDAYSSGLNKCAKIISAGCDAPGVMIDDCSEAFLAVFYSSDMVISKGQGNYETLSDCDRGVYFILKAKCPVISKLIGSGLNEYILKYYEPNSKKSNGVCFEQNNK